MRDIELEQMIDGCLSTVTENQSPEEVKQSLETMFESWAESGSCAYRQKELLEVLVRNPSFVDVVHLSSLLSLYGSGLSLEGLHQVLSLLKVDSPAPRVVLRHLDDALYRRDDRWCFKSVVGIFETLLPQLEDPPAVEEFHNFCAWIFGAKENASFLLSSWLSSGKPALCIFLGSLVSSKDRKGESFEILKRDLPYGGEAQSFISRKAIGYLWFHEVTAASVLLSIVKNGNQSAREYAETLLFSPLLLSYSGELRVFIRSKTGDRSVRVSGCCRRLLKQQDKYLEGLEKTGRLVELSPSSEERHKALFKERKINGEIQQQAYEQSIFASMIKHQRLLYGKQSLSIVYTGNGQWVPSICRLSEYSYSTEIPKLGVVDPVGFEQMIKSFQLEQAGQ